MGGYVCQLLGPETEFYMSLIIGPHPFFSSLCAPVLLAGRLRSSIRTEQDVITFRIIIV